MLATHFNVVAYSRNPNRTCPHNITKVTEEEACAADVLIICVAISALENVLKHISPLLGKNTLVMDTCSVKVHPANTMLETLPETVEILATHPMFGPDSGKNGLTGLPLVYCPLRISEKTNTTWKNNFRRMGLKLVEMSPAQHDREAAYTQGVTHFIGRILGQLNLEPSQIATMGYQKLTDIVSQTCNDPWQLFVDLQQYNPYTVEMREKLRYATENMIDKFNSIEAKYG